MHKKIIRKPPLSKSPVVTRSQDQEYTSIVQPLKNQTTFPTTHILEHVNRIPEIIFVSPTRGHLTLEILRKKSQEITARIEQNCHVPNPPTGEEGMTEHNNQGQTSPMSIYIILNAYRNAVKSQNDKNMSNNHIYPVIIIHVQMPKLLKYTSEANTRQ